MLYTKNYQILFRKRVFMLTALKVLSLVFKCVFYRPEQNAKGGPYGTEFWRSWNAKIKYAIR